MHGRRSQAPAHSAAARRCTQRTTEVQRRQLRHPSEARCQRRCPSCSDPRACTHRGSPLKKPTSRSAPRAPALANSTQHQQRTAGVRKHQLTAKLAADARSVPPRSSDVSCVILPRLGASDAARIRVPARTAAPRLALAKPPPTRYSPACNCRSPHHASASMHSQRSQAPAQCTSSADARSVPPRFSDVSCVILKRLGASDAAPAASILLSARIAAPRQTPRQTPTRPRQPVRNRLSPQHATSSMHSRRWQTPAHIAAARRCTQRTSEVQQRQLRHQ
jgi:hypothetical protein